MPKLLSDITTILSLYALPFAIGVLLFIVVLLILLYLRQYFIESNFGKESMLTLEDAKRKSYELLWGATKKAQEIVGESELAGIKIAADNKATLRKLESQSEQALHDASLDAKTYIERAQQTFTDYLMQLSQQANVSVAESEKVMKDRINKVFEDFEQNLSTYMTETQGQSVRAITLEVQAARQLIDTYKTEQFRLVDENIVAMLERTLSLVLIKKLTLKDNVELVYESLEKAKAEKFII